MGELEGKLDVYLEKGGAVSLPALKITVKSYVDTIKERDLVICFGPKLKKALGDKKKNSNALAVCDALCASVPLMQYLFLDILAL